jgi:hypothetical protein
MIFPILLIAALAGVNGHIPVQDNPNYIWITGKIKFWSPNFLIHSVMVFTASFMRDGPQFFY